MNVLLSKLKEVLSAVLPIVIFVVILSFTLVPVPPASLFQFLIGAAAIIIGLTLILTGVDLTFLPLGYHMGKSFLHSNKLLFVVTGGFLVGFFVCMAEPSIQVLAEQASLVTGGALSSILIRILVAAGAGVLLAVGITRIIKIFSMRKLLNIVLAAVVVLSVFTPADLFAIAFDAAGSATGAVTVPFILSLALGTAAARKDSISGEEDSFGLVGITALGAVFGVLLLNMLVKTDTTGGAIEISGPSGDTIFAPFIAEMPGVAVSSVFTLAPIFVMLFIFQKLKFHLPAKAFNKMLKGFLYAYLGLFLFFVGVNAGFMNMGNMIGYGLAAFDNKVILVGLGFVLGILIVLTEPAVYVFTHQIEDVTNGHIKRKTVLIFLAAGVAFAVGLSMLRIVVPGIMLWHYLLPGYVAAVTLMAITPKLFVGIGFDSGAVAAGPMTATFVLAFSQGVSEAVVYSDVMMDSFGVIAMITLMPILALQSLGFIYKLKLRKSGG